MNKKITKKNKKKFVLSRKRKKKTNIKKKNKIIKSKKKNKSKKHGGTTYIYDVMGNVTAAAQNYLIPSKTDSCVFQIEKNTEKNTENNIIYLLFDNIEINKDWCFHYLMKNGFFNYLYFQTSDVERFIQTDIDIDRLINKIDKEFINKIIKKQIIGQETKTINRSYSANLYNISTHYSLLKNVIDAEGTYNFTTHIGNPSDIVYFNNILYCYLFRYYLKEFCKRYDNYYINSSLPKISEDIYNIIKHQKLNLEENSINEIYDKLEITIRSKKVKYIKNINDFIIYLFFIMEISLEKKNDFKIIKLYEKFLTFEKSGYENIFQFIPKLAANYKEIFEKIYEFIIDITVNFFNETTSDLNYIDNKLLELLKFILGFEETIKYINGLYNNYKSGGSIGYNLVKVVDYFVQVDNFKLKIYDKLPIKCDFIECLFPFLKEENIIINADFIKNNNEKLEDKGFIKCILLSIVPVDLDKGVVPERLSAGGFVENSTAKYNSESKYNSERIFFASDDKDKFEIFKENINKNDKDNIDSNEEYGSNDYRDIYTYIDLVKKQRIDFIEFMKNLGIIDFDDYSDIYRILITKLNEFLISINYNKKIENIEILKYFLHNIEDNYSKFEIDLFNINNGEFEVNNIFDIINNFISIFLGKIDGEYDNPRIYHHLLNDIVIIYKLLKKKKIRKNLYSKILNYDITHFNFIGVIKIKWVFYILFKNPLIKLFKGLIKKKLKQKIEIIDTFDISITDYPFICKSNVKLNKYKQNFKSMLEGFITEIVNKTN